MKTKIILSSLIILLFFIGFVSASDFTPQGDINLRGVYAIKNGTNITANYFFGDASYLTDLNSSSVNHSSLISLQGGTSDEYYHLNQSEHTTLVANILSWITSWFSPDTNQDYLYNDSSTLYFNESRLNETINEIGILNSWNSTYNETYAATSKDVTANRSDWSSTYNESYDLYAYNQTTETYNLYGYLWYNYTDQTFNLYNSSWDNRGLINNSWNESYGNEIYVLKSDSANFVNDSDLEVYLLRSDAGNYLNKSQIESSLNNNISAIRLDLSGSFNSSDFQGSFNDNLSSVEGNLNVNSSDFWDNLGVPTDISNSEFWYNHTTETFNLYNVSFDQSNYVQDNSSWNESYADNLYSGIEWDYNQTTATFNLYNSTWDQSNSYLLYAGIEWDYNQTLATFNLYNTSWDNKGWVTDNFILQSEEGNLNVNNSDYWDDLNTPADINAGDITDDGTYLTSQDYTNVAMLNESGSFAESMNFVSLIDKGNFTTCSDNEVMKMDGSDWVCELIAAGGDFSFTDFSGSFVLNISDWEAKVNSSYLNIYNATYDATSKDVTANRSEWFRTDNSSYVLYNGASENVFLEGKDLHANNIWAQSSVYATIFSVLNASDNDGYAGFGSYNDLSNSTGVAFISYGSAYSGEAFNQSKANLSRIYGLNSPLAIGTYNEYDFILGVNDGEVMRLNLTNDAKFQRSVEAEYFIGDGSKLTNLPAAGNSSWNESYATGLYVLKIDSANFVNTSTLTSYLTRTDAAQHTNKTYVDQIRSDVGSAANTSYVDQLRTDSGNAINITEISEDTSPQLGGYLDANGQNIGSTTDEIENIYVGTNTRIYFGDGQDSSIYFNGTNLVISG